MRWPCTLPHSGRHTALAHAHNKCPSWTFVPSWAFCAVMGMVSLVSPWGMVAMAPQHVAAVGAVIAYAWDNADLGHCLHALEALKLGVWPIL